MSGTSTKLGGDAAPGAVSLRLALAALCVIAAVQLFCVPAQYLGAEHDDAQYVLAARSLLRGQYTLGVSPGDPPLTFVTPGWPALLAPAAAFSGDSAAGYEIWSWLWLVLCDVLAWLWLRRRIGGWGALAGTAFFALNPLTLSRAGVVMSEVPFLAAVLGLLLALDSKRFPAWAAGLWLATAWMIRPGAAPLYPAVLGIYLVRKSWKELGICAAASLIPVLAWRLWVASAGAQLAEVAEMSLVISSWAELIPLAAFNAEQLLTLLGRVLLPWPPHVIPGVAAMLVGAVVLYSALHGAQGHYFRHSYEPAGMFLLCALGLHLVWPYWYDRYLLPYLPFVAWGVWQALARRPRAALALLAVLAAAPVLGQGLSLSRSITERRVPDLERTYAWVRSNTDPAALFSSAFFCRDALYASRPFIPLPVSSSEGRMTSAAAAEKLKRRRARYVLWVELPGLGSSKSESFVWRRRLSGLRRALEGPAFRPVHFEPTEGAAIFEVR